MLATDAQAGGERSYWGKGHSLLIDDFHARLDDPEPFWIGPADGLVPLRVLREVYRQSGILPAGHEPEPRRRPLVTPARSGTVPFPFTSDRRRVGTERNRPRPVQAGGGDLGGEVAGAVAVVDVDHRDARGAGVEHREQRRRAPRRRRRSRPRSARRRPGAATRPATTLGRAPSMPATTTITAALRSRSRRPRIRCRPATPDVGHQLGAAAEVRGHQLGLAGDRQVGGARAAPRRRARRSGAGGSAGHHSSRDSGSWPASGSSASTAAACSAARAGEQGLGRALAHRGGDQPQLGRRLRLAVDRLRDSRGARPGRSRGRRPRAARPAACQSPSGITPPAARPAAA